MNFDINWLFVIAGLAAILIELFVGIETGFDLVLLGIALVAGGLVGNWTASWQTGLAVAIVIAILYIFLGRKFIKSRLAVATKHTNIDQLIGKIAVVTKSVKPSAAGQVKIDSELWRAEADISIAVGTKVKVLSVEGVTLKVYPD